MGTLLIFVSVLIYVNVVTMTHATKVFPVVEEQYAGTFVADVREIYNPRIVGVTSSSLQVTKDELLMRFVASFVDLTHFHEKFISYF